MDEGFEFQDEIVAEAAQSLGTLCNTFADGKATKRELHELVFGVVHKLTGYLQINERDLQITSMSTQDAARIFLNAVPGMTKREVSITASLGAFVLVTFMTVRHRASVIEATRVTNQMADEVIRHVLGMDCPYGDPILCTHERI